MNSASYMKRMLSDNKKIGKRKDALWRLMTLLQKLGIGSSIGGKAEVYARGSKELLKVWGKYGVSSGK